MTDDNLTNTTQPKLYTTLCLEEDVARNFLKFTCSYNNYWLEKQPNDIWWVVSSLNEGGEWQTYKVFPLFDATDYRSALLDATSWFIKNHCPGGVDMFKLNKKCEELGIEPFEIVSKLKDSLGFAPVKFDYEFKICEKTRAAGGQMKKVLALRADDV